MTLHELAVFLAYVSTLTSGGRDVAILVRADTRLPVSIAFGTQDQANPFGSAVVRLLRHAASIGFAPTEYFVYTSRRPQLMDLGMGLRCHVTHMYFHHDGEVRFLAPRNLLAPPQAQPGNAPLIPSGSAAAATVYARADALGAPILHCVRDANLEAVSAWLTVLKSIEAINVPWIGALKALLVDPPAPRHFVPPAAQLPCGIPMTRPRDRIFITLAHALLGRIRPTIAADPGKNVACVLVDASGCILSWAVNTNDTDATCHAEVNCLASYFAISRQALPTHCVLYTTLQCCEMCASMLSTSCRQLRVVYAERDPGLAATLSTLPVDGITEELFGAAASRPLVRAMFRRAVGRSMDMRRAQAATQIKKTTQGNLMRGGGDKGAAATAAQLAYDQFLQGKPATLQWIPRARFPRSITTALESNDVEQMLVGEVRHFLRLGPLIALVVVLRELKAQAAMRQYFEEEPQDETLAMIDQLYDMVMSEDRLLLSARDSDLFAWFNALLLLGSVP